MKRWPAISSALLPLVVVKNVLAVPSFQVSVQGSCPSRTELVRALDAKGSPVGMSHAEYMVHARSDPTGAWLQLTRSSGERVIERHFSSDDCRALADAMAVVIEAYFVEVGELPKPLHAPAEAPPPAVTITDAAAPTSSASAAGAPISTTQTRNAPEAWVLPTTVLVQRQWFRVVPKPLPALFPRAFMGIGPSLSLPQGSAALALEVGGGVDLPKPGIFSEVAATTNLPVVVGPSPNRVWRWMSQALLRVGVPLGTELGYRPWIGVGVAVTRLRAEDLPAPPTRTTLRPLVGAGVEVTWPLGGFVHGRAELGCAVYPYGDIYRVDSTDEIGRGPRAVCTTALGLGLGGLPVKR